MSWPHAFLRHFDRGTEFDPSSYILILDETNDDNGFRWFCLQSEVTWHLISDHQWEAIRSMVKTGCQAIRLSSGTGPNGFVVEHFPPALTVLNPPRADSFRSELSQFYRVYHFDTELEAGPTYSLVSRDDPITTARVKATGVYYNSHTHWSDPYRIKYPSEYTDLVIEKLEAYHHLRDSAYTLPIVGLIASTHPFIDPSFPVALTHTLVDGFLFPFHGAFCAMHYSHEWTDYETEIIIMHLIDGLVDFESRGLNVSNLCRQLIWLTPDGLKIVEPSTQICNLNAYRLYSRISEDILGTPSFTVYMLSIVISQAKEKRHIPLLECVLKQCQQSKSVLQLRDSTAGLFYPVRRRCTTIGDLFLKRRARISMQASPHEYTFGCTTGDDRSKFTPVFL